MSVTVVIPARYASTRYPGKPLVPLRGADGVARTLLEWTWLAGKSVRGIDRLVVATDDDRIADHALLQEWITYARRLASMFKEATGQEPPPEPTTRARGIGPGDLARLARTIQAYFSMEEIDSLAFELGVTSAMSGDTAEARARAMVDIARKRGLIARLIQLYREQRPNGGLDD